MAINSGNIKNIAICLNNDLFIIFSSAPSFLSILYLSLLSVLSVNSFSASMATLAIKNTIPKYNPKNVTNAPSPILASLISTLLFTVGKLYSAERGFCTKFRICFCISLCSSKEFVS